MHYTRRAAWTPRSLHIRYCGSRRPGQPKRENADADRRRGDDRACNGEPPRSAIPFGDSEEGDNHADEAEEHTERSEEKGCGKRNTREDEPGQTDTVARCLRDGVRQRRAFIRP